MTSAAMRSSMSLPRRWETSRTRSFSRRPLGPSVPLSWPPWPGSMTTRLILRPRARMSEFWPELVWRAALAISSGGACVVEGGAVTAGLEAGDLEAGSVAAGSVVAGSVAAGSVAGDGAASFCVEAGGAGLGGAGARRPVFRWMARTGWRWAALRRTGRVKWRRTFRLGWKWEWNRTRGAIPPSDGWDWRDWRRW